MAFLDDNFLLHSTEAQTLYHNYAASMPIIDYHNHLPPQQIAQDATFDNITQIWLNGDHYKWRAMRGLGIDEAYCTGHADDWEKFEKWAFTVPYTLRNPLYHWTHLELRRYFGIETLLSHKTAREVYEKANEQLKQPEFSVRNLLRRMNVRLLCTTDDPTDTLEWHQQIANDTESGLIVLPAFRPDKAMAIENPESFNSWTDLLAERSGTSIQHYEDFLSALKNRHDFFARNGARVSDHGLEQIYAVPYTDQEITAAFRKLRDGHPLDQQEALKFKSALLHEFAIWDWEKGWVQQFHLGAMRNNNTRALRTLGADTGWDSIGDYPQGISLSRFLDRLDTNNQLAKTILYNLNPSNNELFAAMTGNFNDGSVTGKIQFGSGWWFLDQKIGMEQQMNALSNMGLLSQFVGMLTDSRSFLSFPRHEYFRRILCNLLGEEIFREELPVTEIEWIGEMVRDICYRNARQYFGFTSLLGENP
jgi:glucuronate isomerase